MGERERAVESTVHLCKVEEREKELASERCDNDDVHDAYTNRIQWRREREEDKS